MEKRIHDASPHAAVRFTSVSFGYHRNRGYDQGQTAPEQRRDLVLKDLSLEIPGGSITAVLGPNGVGKTTLLNLILGWLKPLSGAVQLFGRDSRDSSRREMGLTLSLVPQDEHIPFEYTTLDYVLLGRAPHLGPLQAPRREDISLALAALKTVGLSHLAHRNIAETSGGEKQLAMVARSLAQQPMVVLMDEPTAHLDLKNRRRMVDLIHRLQQDGVTVILTTHDPDFASVAADRMVLLDGGTLLAEGPLQRVMHTENLRRVFDMELEVRRFTAPDGVEHTVVTW